MAVSCPSFEGKGSSSSTEDDSVEEDILDEITSDHKNEEMSKHIRGTILSLQSSSEPVRKVDINFYLWRVHDIDTVQQRFSVTITLYFTWVEDNPDNIDSLDDNADWQLKDFKWTPRITVRSILEVKPEEKEEWFRVTNRSQRLISKKDYFIASKSENPYQQLKITQCVKQTLTLSEAFELQNFPVDLQLLHIQLGSAWNCKDIALRFNKQVPSTMNPRPLDSQEWEMHAPRLIAYDTVPKEDDHILKMKEHDLPLLSYSSQSASNSIYPKAYIALTASRKPQFYLWNIYIMLFLLGTLSFTIFPIEPEDMGERLSNMLTLVLALVAFKLYLAQSLPSISYLTMLDSFTLGSMILMFFISVTTSTLPSLGLERGAVMAFDHAILIICAILWVVLNIWFVVRFCQLYRNRKAKIKIIEDRFKKMREESQRKTI